MVLHVNNESMHSLVNMLRKSVYYINKKKTDSTLTLQATIDSRWVKIVKLQVWADKDYFQ